MKQLLEIMEALRIKREQLECYAHRIAFVQFAGTGLTNREIAERLSLSQHTIARHIANARAKPLSSIFFKKLLS